MKISAIVCEYNPFHNGHHAHIEFTRQKSCCDYIICVMSGNFVQRGEPAIINKYTRAEIAIKSGADLVIELPTVFAVNNAETFSFGAVRLISQINNVKYLSFGSESADIIELEKWSDFFLNEPSDFKTILAENLKKGMSLNNARSAALLEYNPKLEANILTPNNILAIEYLKALKKLNCKIKPMTLKRIGSHHTDKNLGDSFSSASAIRQHILNGATISELQSNVPKDTFNAIMSCQLPSMEAFSNMVLYKLRTTSSEDLQNVYDVNEGFENAILNACKKVATYNELVETLTTKRYSAARIKRILLNAVLGIDKELVENAKMQRMYARVLAIKESSKDVLSAFDRDVIDLITRKGDYNNHLKDKVLDTDMRAMALFSQLTFDTKHSADELNGIVIV